MKAINNQWQLPSAICRLIIMLLTVLLLNWSTQSHHRPISGSPLKGRLGFFRYLAKCGYLVSGVTDRAGGNIPAFPPCVFTYTLPLLAHSTLWKHNSMPVKYRVQFKNVCHTLHTHHRKVELWKPQKKIQTYYIYSFKSMYVCLKVLSKK